MDRTPSLHEMIESLRRTVAFHREREAFHAQQQAQHAQQEKVHGEDTLGGKPNLSKALDQVLASWPPEVSFTATSIAAEVGRRYGAVLRRDVDPRAIAAALRRRRDDGLVQEIREGRPFQEALYRKPG
jgi:hypothetical protein